MGLLAVARADGGTEPGDFLREQLREEREGLGEGVVLVSRSLDDGLIGGVQRLRAVGLSVVAVVLATHTYRGIYHAGNTPSGREVAFSEDVRRLELAGAAVCVVRHPGGVAAFAGGRQGVAGVRGVV